MSVRVIVHADDFGLHPALNGAIEFAHRCGLVTSASLMPLGPAFADALRSTRDLPTLDLGLHFTLVGVPGLPPTLAAFLSAYARGCFPARVAEDHLRRQFAALGGLPISHIDSHQHLHALPGLMRVVCRFASKHGIPAVRLPIDGPAFAPVPAGRRVQAAALAAVSRLSRRTISAYGLRTSDYFSGMAVSGHLTGPLLAAYLQNARPGLTEIVCHPGLDNRALREAFDWGYDWQGETAALRSDSAWAAVRDRDIVLTGWRDTNQVSAK